MNYQSKTGSSVVCTELLDHAKREKENLPDLVTPSLLTKAINECFLNKVKKVNKREGYAFVKVYSNLGRREKPTHVNMAMNNCDEEWHYLLENLPVISEEIGQSKWKVVCNDNAINILHFEDIRFDGKVVVSEIVITKSSD